MKDICKNCGGWKGLHHYQTGQCPVGGVEAPIGRVQDWKVTTFEQEDDEDKLRAQIAALREALKNSLESQEWMIDIVEGETSPRNEDYESIREAKELLEQVNP